MTRPLLIGLLLLTAAVAGRPAHAQSPPPPDAQIAAAVRAAPPPMRAAATVRGYTSNGTLTTLREGDGRLVCLADDPTTERFHASCYHKALAPFMQRGRELRREGRSGAAVDSLRKAEIEAGTLAYPDRPVALYNLSGDTYDAAADTVRGGARMRVLYVPYATAESTGLPTTPKDGPWLMAPGEPWAHVMMTGS